MDPTMEFFEGLNHRAPDPLLGGIRGTMRFDLEQGGEDDTWLLVFSAGNVSATQIGRPADCTVRTTRDTFHQIVTGETNPFAALLRNQVTVEGKLTLYGYLNHLIPGPPGAHHPRGWVREREQRR